MPSLASRPGHRDGDAGLLPPALRQITRLFLQLPDWHQSRAIVKQIRRWPSGWLQYHRLKLVIRAVGVVHADETGWRTNGKNGIDAEHGRSHAASRTAHAALK
jgi:hypothetical protein